MKPVVPWTPRSDGIDHVNVYSRARTAEGKLLSNFAPIPFHLHGYRFASVEGFYQSMLYDDDGDRARIATLSGTEAKSWGARAGKDSGDRVRTWGGQVVPFRGPEFQEEIRTALRAKVEQNPQVGQALLATEHLVLTHYYVRFGRPIIPAGETGLMTTCLTTLRRQLEEASGAPTAARTEADVVWSLRHATEETRLQTARCLVFAPQPLAGAMIRALAQCLEDPALSVRLRALRTLVQTELDSQEMIDVYGPALSNESAVVRLVAIRQLARLRTEARSARRPLEALRQDPDKVVRLFAEAALAQITAEEAVC